MNVSDAVASTATAIPISDTVEPSLKEKEVLPSIPTELTTALDELSWVIVMSVGAAFPILVSRLANTSLVMSVARLVVLPAVLTFTEAVLTSFTTDPIVSITAFLSASDVLMVKASTFKTTLSTAFLASSITASKLVVFIASDVLAAA